mgnify:CR=1 FL=1
MAQNPLRILNQNYWQEDSPIKVISVEVNPNVVAADNEVSVLFTVKNIANEAVIALKGQIRTYDIFKDYIQENEFKWTDVRLEPGKTQEAVYHSTVSKESVHIEVVIDQVVFDDFNVRNIESDTLYLHDEIPDEYYCECGEINPSYNSACHSCGKEIIAFKAQKHDEWEVGFNLHAHESIASMDISLEKIHVITSENRIFAYGSNVYGQANPHETATFIAHWQEITNTFQSDTDNPIVNIQGRFAIRKNGELVTWAVLDCPDTMNPFTLNSQSIDSMGLENINEYLVLSPSQGEKMYTLKVATDLAEGESVKKMVASSDYMALFILTNYGNIYHWSHNIDQILIYEFDPFNLKKISKVPKDILDIKMSDSALIMHTQKEIYIYGHNYLKGLFEGQFSDRPKKVYLPFSELSSSHNLDDIVDVVTNSTEKALIVQFENQLFYYLGYIKDFYIPHQPTKDFLKSGHDISKSVHPPEKSVKRLYFKSLGISVLIDNSVFFWGVFSFKRTISFSQGLDITNIFPLEQNEKIVDYHNDETRIPDITESVALDKFDQFFMTNKNRIFALRYNDFVIAAEIKKTNHFVVEEVQ